MVLNEKIKNKLWIIFAVVFVIVFIVWVGLSPRPDHIKDTNGADNYVLQEIKERDVVANSMGCRGSIKESETNWDVAGFNLSSGIKYSSKKFTGVYVLHTATIFKGSDIYVCLTNFQIKSGNFAFYVLLDGEIVGQVKPDEFGFSELTINNITKTGTLEYIIAGESANFKFTAPSEW